ncbi:MAG: tricarballylate utilization 4Fe-4S protein TcuB [Proteobacteria bacterium]|nr:tricarballylate utilization 4Fe-4S protein TcuB [Pseudomonadota bacterium]
MRATEAAAEARRVMEICNACRYCEGFCAVFPAMTLKRDFSDADVSYLANLCHGCRGCYYACQYAPPHEWGVNVPATFALLRTDTYAEYAWPPRAAALFQRNGVVVSLALAAAVALVLILAGLANPGGAFTAARPVAPGAFYDVIPLWAMQVVGIASFGFALAAMAMGARNFWRDAGARGAGPVAIGLALWDVLTLRNLGGGGNGCNDNSERFSMRRRWLHHAMFYGFMLCFAATCTGFVYHAFLGWHAPYPLLSAPVVLGTVGGALLLAGTGGMIAMRQVADPAVNPRALLGADLAVLVLLSLSALTGLVLLALRGTGAMGPALAVHLGVILALFVTLPYSRMIHGVYRGLALLRRAAERNMTPTSG